MKRLSLNLLFVLLVTFITAQTKTDTQQWIIEKIQSNRLLSEWGVHSYQVSFDHSNLILIKGSSKYYSYDKVPINKISQISVEYWHNSETNKEGYLIQLKLKCHCLDAGEYINGEFKPYNVERSDNVTIYLDKSFGNDNMPSRMKKALTHLVHIYGGTLSQKRKETF